MFVLHDADFISFSPLFLRRCHNLSIMIKLLPEMDSATISTYEWYPYCVLYGVFSLEPLPPDSVDHDFLIELLSIMSFENKTYNNISISFLKILFLSHFQVPLFANSGKW